MNSINTLMAEKAWLFDEDEDKMFKMKENLAKYAEITKKDITSLTEIFLNLMEKKNYTVDQIEEVMGHALGAIDTSKL